MQQQLLKRNLFNIEYSRNMDIVSRLRKFIDYIGIPVTQFADTCRIPRPTLSQLLNGRNKKVSDELIGKIHEAYPSLSVLWLMFGEGTMETGANIEISEPQKQALHAPENSQPTELQATLPELDFTSDYTDSFANEDEDLASENSSAATTADDAEKIISFSTDRTRKIVNIIVYYDDNSFESFVPGHRNISSPSGKP